MLGPVELDAQQVITVVTSMPSIDSKGTDRPPVRERSRSCTDVVEERGITGRTLLAGIGMLASSVVLVDHRGDGGDLVPRVASNDSSRRPGADRVLVGGEDLGPRRHALGVVIARWLPCDRGRQEPAEVRPAVPLHSSQSMMAAMSSSCASRLPNRVTVDDGGRHRFRDRVPERVGRTRESVAEVVGDRLTSGPSARPPRPVRPRARRRARPRPAPPSAVPPVPCRGDLATVDGRRRGPQR